ncbi:hypothetical protein, partial [Streptomyces sp. NPDC058255]|uniref:hypothetical protein n=1 Tax=Streptomyces sp. NPDC058255 TaxID=3346407 RepID=UPI0036E96135
HTPKCYSLFCENVKVNLPPGAGVSPLLNAPVFGTVNGPNSGVMAGGYLFPASTQYASLMRSRHFFVFLPSAPCPERSLPHTECYLPQAGQSLCLARKAEAKGCGSAVSPGHEVRHVLQILSLKLAAFLVRERLAVAPPRDDQQQSHKLRQADGNQSRSSFGVGMEDRTFLAAFTAEEIRAASTVAGEPLKRAARGKVHFLDMVSSVQVEVTRPSEKAGTMIGNQSHRIREPKHDSCHRGRLAVTDWAARPGRPAVFWR